MKITLRSVNFSLRRVKFTLRSVKVTLGSVEMILPKVKFTFRSDKIILLSVKLTLLSGKTALRSGKTALSSIKIPLPFILSLVNNIYEIQTYPGIPLRLIDKFFKIFGKHFIPPGPVVPNPLFNIQFMVNFFCCKYRGEMLVFIQNKIIIPRSENYFH